MNLKYKTCVPCKVGAPTLKKDKINNYLKEVDNWKWEKEPDKIVKEFELKDFKEAIAFVNKVAEVAESEGHHPNIYIHSYKKVKIEIWTHKMGGLHQNDFILAAKIDNL
ncbi:MAG: 4a-hydroxytetrahydrobiopterin dehydratase [Candidatus Woesebacteria bacterium]|jgi:4a-hydroxytetrahydrobiopterin dehydratase